MSDSRVSVSRGFTGPAEVVFGVLTDPDRAARWLPRAESVSTERVKVRSGDHMREFTVEVVPDRLQVRWRPVDGDGAEGEARVEDAPAGGSVVHAELTVPASGDRRTAEAALQEALRNLQSDVSDNFNAG